MFNLGFPELMMLGGVALLVFGPKRLPELAKGLGKGIRDFKKALEGNGEEEKEKAVVETERLPPAETVAQSAKKEPTATPLSEPLHS